MIKEIRELRAKYAAMSKNSEYVDVQSVVNDLYYLEQEARLKRLPKHLR